MLHFGQPIIHESGRDGECSNNPKITDVVPDDATEMLQKKAEKDSGLEVSSSQLSMNDATTAKELRCEICDFTAEYPSKMARHKETQKHKARVARQVTEQKVWRCACGKQYKHRASYHRHKKDCANHKAVETGSLKDLLIAVMDENKELYKMMQGQQRQISELIPQVGNTINNTINNTFNLQLFLNEECKEALNMSEFIETLDIQLHDLEHTKKHGLEDGVMNIFLNGLRKVGTYRRPIHCTDVKRETLYVKDDDEWEKVDDNREQIRKPLSDIADKQRKSIQQWEDANPTWSSTESGRDEWVHLVGTVMGTVDDHTPSENRIIKGIAKEVKIN